jgi:hypothetical protein
MSNVQCNIVTDCKAGSIGNTLLRAMSGFRLIDQGRNGDTKNELQIADINSRIAEYRIGKNEAKQIS